jgi:hypothetical protein
VGHVRDFHRRISQEEQGYRGAGSGRRVCSQSVLHSLAFGQDVGGKRLYEGRCSTGSSSRRRLVPRATVTSSRSRRPDLEGGVWWTISDHPPDRSIAVGRTRNLGRVDAERWHGGGCRQAVEKGSVGLHLQSSVTDSCRVYILAAYRRLHRTGVLHRDVRPRHWLRGVDGRIMIIDFDVALQLEPGDESFEYEERDVCRLLDLNRA